MSKSAVPEVYARIIRDVCEASRVDFEEGGVDLTALNLLKTGWQNKLTSYALGTFPWEPKPELPAKQEPPSASNNIKPTAAQLATNGVANSPSSSASTPGPQVKQEQTYTSQPQASANYQAPQYAGAQQMSAQQRAAMSLQQRYGDQASSQIAQLQGGQSSRVPVPPNGQAQPQQQVPNQGQPYIKPEPQDYGQTFNTQMPIKSSQTDGTGDALEEYRTEAARRRALIAQNRESNDRLMHSQFLASQNALEAGGVMLPLGAQTASKSGMSSSTAGPSSLARAQGDAAADDDVADEDAINSDLDDPDELGDNENDDDLIDNTILCTYDKVQRVKNKWKCTLKDGVFRTKNTGDYVFHKGQGEFEW